MEKKIYIQLLRNFLVSSDDESRRKCK